MSLWTWIWHLKTKSKYSSKQSRFELLYFIWIELSILIWSEYFYQNIKCSGRYSYWNYSYIIHAIFLIWFFFLTFSKPVAAVIFVNTCSSLIFKYEWKGPSGYGNHSFVVGLPTSVKISQMGRLIFDWKDINVVCGIKWEWRNYIKLVKLSLKFVNIDTV